MNLIRFWSLKGECSYSEVRRLQLALVQERAQDRIPDTILFLEHSPVVTRGRGLQFTGTPKPRHVPLQVPLPTSIEFAESERGGDLTYHGPGQLVIYPICKLDGQGFGPAQSVVGFLRKLEDVMIDSLRHFGLEGSCREGATGVWVGEKKIASIGIAVRRWVTYHGVAINAVNDLSGFRWISPCGFDPSVMTRLSDWTNLGEGWRECLEDVIAERIDPKHLGERVQLELGEALASVENFPIHPEDEAAPAELTNHF